MELFINNTIDPSIFLIKDVINDNSCLYRSLANTLHLRMDGDDNICAFNRPSNIINDENFSYDGILQEEIARELQEKAYHWIVTNLDKEYPSLGISISDMIINCHEMSVEEYISYYKFFAGDLIVRNIKRNNKTITELVPNRWGSILELYALSIIYSVPICVYISQKYDIKNERIITGKIRTEKPEKGVRFRMSEIVGEEFLVKTPPIFILWRKTQCGPHYMSLYPKEELWMDNNKELKNKN